MRTCAFRRGEATRVERPGLSRLQQQQKRKRQQRCNDNKSPQPQPSEAAEAKRKQHLNLNMSSLSVTMPAQVDLGMAQRSLIAGELARSRGSGFREAGLGFRVQGLGFREAVVEAKVGSTGAYILSTLGLGFLRVRRLGSILTKPLPNSISALWPSLKP